MKSPIPFLHLSILLAAGCAVENPGSLDRDEFTHSTAVVIEDLELEDNELPAWENDARTLTEGSIDGFAVFNSVEQLANEAINGGAYQYNHEDIDRAAIQVMRRPDGNDTSYAEVRIFDMGTHNAAVRNMNDYLGDIDAHDSLPEFGYVKYRTETTWCDAYAAYGKFYVELQLFGYDSGDEALVDAKQFLSLYEQTIPPAPETDTTYTDTTKNDCHPSDGGTCPLKVEHLELTEDDLPGWQNREAWLVEGRIDGFAVFNSVEDLADNAINGGAYQYNHQDIERAAIQLMGRTENGKTYLAETRIFSMGTYEAAKENLDDYTAHRSESIDSLPELGYVKYDTGTTSCIAYAAFGKFYIEISMWGYTSGDAALIDAREFLDIYKRKISANPDSEVSVAVRVLSYFAVSEFAVPQADQHDCRL